jgi:hypothetical protein
VQIILDAARVGGTWSNWYDSFMRCGGFNGRDRNCVPELDTKFAKYLASNSGKLLFRAGIPSRGDAGDRTRIAAAKMAGCVPNGDDRRLRLSVGGHNTENLV